MPIQDKVSQDNSLNHKYSKQPSIAKITISPFPLIHTAAKQMYYCLQQRTLLNLCGPSCTFTVGFI